MIRWPAPSKTSDSTGPMSRSEVDDAGHLGVRGVGQQQVDALGAEPGEAAEVGEPAVERQLVHLEVAGVQHDPGRGLDRDGERVRDRVVDREELQARTARAAAARPRLDFHLRGRDPVLDELALDQREREPGADQRDVGPLPQQVRHRADVVLVRVREHERVDLVQPALERGEVRQDQVDAGLVLLGEQDAAVHHEQPAGVLEDRHVAADLAEPAERDQAQATGGQRRRGPQLWVRMAHLSFTPPAVRSSRSCSISAGVASDSGSRTGPPGRPEQARAPPSS